MRRADSHEAVLPLWQREAAPSGRQHDAQQAHRARCEAELAQARERGYQDGYAEGQQQAREQVEQTAAADALESQRSEQAALQRLQQQQAQLQALMRALPQALAAQQEQAHETAVIAAFAAVTRFFGERHANRELMGELVEHALAHAVQPVHTLAVAPGDADQLHGLVDGIQIVADPRLQPGQCSLETTRGHYDTGVDVRLDLLKSALLAGLATFRSEQVPA